MRKDDWFMILMPCVRNKVPTGEETERWEASVCPQCGKACWKPLHPRVRRFRKLQSLLNDCVDFVWVVCGKKKKGNACGVPFCEGRYIGIIQWAELPAVQRLLPYWLHGRRLRISAHGSGWYRTVIRFRRRPFFRPCQHSCWSGDGR